MQVLEDIENSGGDHNEIPTILSEEIKGLNTVEGFQCPANNCNFLATKKCNWESHKIQKHPNENLVSKSVQFYKIKYGDNRVLELSTAKQPVSSGFSENMKLWDELSQNSRVNADDKLFCYFDSNLGWSRFYEANGYENCLKLVSFDECPWISTERANKISDYALLYLEKINQEINSISSKYILVNLIDNFRKLQNNESVKAYSNILARFILFFARKNNDKDVTLSLFMEIDIATNDKTPIFSCITNILLFTLSEKVSLVSEDDIFLSEFVKLLSCNPSESFNVQGITQNIAKVMWCLRAAVFSKIIDSKTSLGSPVCQEYIKLVSSNFENPFSVLLNLFRFAECSHDFTQELNMFWYDGDKEKNTFVIDGVFYKASALQKMAVEASNIIENQLDTLLMGKKIPNLCDVKDDVKNHSVNYSIIIEGKKNSNYLFEQNIDDRFAMNYLAKVDKFIETMIGLIHLCSGMPSRATELATIRIKNEHSGSRNIFFLANNYACIVLRYNKTNNIKKQDSIIPHFLPKKLALILKCYLVVVVPYVKLCCAKIYGKVTAENYSTFLGVRSGTVMEAKDIRLTWEKFTAKFFGLTIKFSHYRHLAIAMMRDKIKFEAEDLNPYVPKQLGHSQTTNQSIYAITCDFMNASSIENANFLNVSMAWHKFLLVNVNDLNMSGTEHSNEKKPETILKNLYGHDATFREGQLSKIESIMDLKKDVLIVAGTGSGKTLLHVVPTLLEKSCTILIIPLKSLLLNQSQFMEKKGKNF